MVMAKLPSDGGCRCGRLRFRLTEVPWLETAFHCRGCQRMTASASSTTLVVPEGGMGFVNVRATLLDDPYWFAPWLETQTAEKLAWLRPAPSAGSSGFRRWKNTRP